MSNLRFPPLGFAVLLSLAACAGERPTVTPQQGPAQIVATDPAVIAVSELFDSPATEFTAKYKIQPSAVGADPVTATVTRSGPAEHVRVGEVDFFVNPSGDVTCNGKGRVCSTGINEQFLSSLNLTHSFWAASTNQRLLNDASRKIGTPTAHEETIAKKPATCVDIAVAGPTADGSVTYCATDTGVLARYVGADATIELTRYSKKADVEELTPPPTTPTG